MDGTTGSIDDVAHVTKSKWGDDLSKHPLNNPYRLMHAYIVAGNRSEARKCYEQLLERGNEVGEGLGQYISIEMILGPGYKEIQTYLNNQG